MSGNSPTPQPSKYADLPPGTSIGGFRIERRLGAGAMGAVYQATETALGRTVAIKVLPPQMAWDQGFRERFVRESRTASAVDHPNIIPVYAAGEDAGVLYLAMRYVPGGDLHGLLGELGPLSPKRAMSVIAPVAAALDTAHRAGIVHRDVKPANILVDRIADGALHPYLSDFGLAMASELPRMTQVGLFLGTAAYAAPEQLDGRGAGPRADQYSLACVAYQILTGQMPFRGDSMAAQMVARLAGLPRVTELRPDLPAEADDVLTTGMAADPEDRYASCGDLARAIADVLGSEARDVSDIHLGIELRIGRQRYAGGTPLRPAGASSGVQVPQPRGVPSEAETRPPVGSPDTRSRAGRRGRLIGAGAAIAAVAAAVGLGAALLPSLTHDTHHHHRAATAPSTSPESSASARTTHRPGAPQATGALVRARTLHVPGHHAITAARFRPQDGGIAVLDTSGAVTGYESQAWHQIQHVTVSPGGAPLRLSAARFARKNLTVVVPSADCAGGATGSCLYRPFESSTGKPWQPVAGGTGPILSIANDLMAVATPAHDGIDIWNAVRHERADHALGRSEDRVHSVALDPTGQAMAVGVSTPAGQTRIKWLTDVLHPNGRTPRVVATIPHTLAGPRILLTGETLAAGDDRRTELHRAMPARPNQRVVATLAGGLLALSPANGDLAATLDRDEVKVWDDAALLPSTWPSGSAVDRSVAPHLAGTVTCGAARPTAATFSPDGRSLAVGCSDGALYLWDVD